MGDTDKELCVESEEIRPNLLHRLLSKLWDNYSGNLIVICFFLLGFCNSAPAVIMLSAAHDLLSAETLNVGGANVNYKNSTLVKNLTYNKYDCNEMSTGIVLLADVLPGICIKLVAPFFAHKFKYWQRLLFVIYCCSASFLLVALTPSSMQWLIFIGIMHASLATSFGEMTFLSMSTLYPTKLSLAAWAAGTGTTGFLSTFIYAALTSLAGLSMSTTILSMLFIPVLMAASFLALPSPEYSKANFRESIELNISIIYKEKNVKSEMDMDALSPLSKLKLVRPLLRYMVPLFVVYYAEYLMNQGLFELIYFPNDKLLNSHSLQYRWYNVMFRFGVFVARCTIRCFQITALPIFPIFQLLNFFILFTHVLFGYMPSVVIVLAIILWEGLVGGACYANALYLVSTEVSKELREFSISVATIADTAGIVMAGLTAIPLHNLICSLGQS